MNIRHLSRCLGAHREVVKGWLRVGRGWAVCVGVGLALVFWVVTGKIENQLGEGWRGCERVHAVFGKGKGC